MLSEEFFDMGMSQVRLFVLVGLPPPVQAIFGEENVDRLSQAHPRVRVAVVDTPERFADLLPEADGVFLGFSFRVTAAALQPGTRLRWVHSIPAGANLVLTPELVAAVHVVVTSTKGPMAPIHELSRSHSQRGVGLT